ncbi:MAG: hypothetical protein NC489_21645 [Ruminococcus flavefaciens]|nr:hypothetical protein [Ruminococcus flavefaciens]
MDRIVKPVKVLSFEDALRNLASRLTGTPVAELPRTQEAIVQYMAENVPSMDELGEAVTQEVLARIAKSTGANLTATEPAEAAQDGAEGAGGTSTPPAAETPQEGSQAATEGTSKSKTASKTKSKAKA